MESNKTSAKLDVQTERLVLFNRLIQQKDAILNASMEIENSRKRFLQANKKDEDGTIECEIQQRIYVIISALSELVAYSKNEGISQILLTTVQMATQHRTYEHSQFISKEVGDKAIDHIALSKVLDALCASANMVSVEWRLRKDPLVNFQNLESILQMKLPGAP